MRFAAPIPMRDMASFYAMHDVLIAPSIWPESFGLVTREAASTGMFVIATDSGALAADLKGMPNAFVIKQTDPGRLAGELADAITKLPAALASLEGRPVIASGTNYNT